MIREFEFAAVIAAGAVGVGAATRAHVAVPSQQPSCKVDSAAAWYRKQRDWLSENGRTWTNDSLRAVLLSVTGVDPRHLDPQMGVHIASTATAAPSANLMDVIGALRKLPRGTPGPTRSVVGAAGARAYYLLAMVDTSYTRGAMHRMMEAGPDESLAADVASLEDVTRLAAGRKQIYGTQFVRDNGKVMLAPMEDSAHADMRRENAGLPPFALSLCVAKGGR